MNTDSAVNADEMEQLQVEETDDSSRLECYEIVPLTRATDGSCTAKCVSGAWSLEVKQESFAVVKQEPDEVCWIIYDILILSTQWHIKNIIVS